MNVDRILAQAKSYTKTGEINEAIKLYEKLLKVFPENQRAKKQLKLLQDKGSFSNQSNLTQSQIDSVLELYHKGQLKDALNVLDDLNAQYSGIAILHNIRGACFHGLGQFESAKACYEQAVNVNPDYVEAYTNLGNALKDLEKFDEAINRYKQALAINPSYIEAHYDLANVFKSLGQYDKAISCYERVLEIKPSYVEAHNNLANTFKELGLLHKAVMSYKRAIEFRPDYAVAYNNLGNVLCSLGQVDAAIRCYKRALDIDPVYVEAYCNLANVFRDIGQLDAAVSCLEHALDINPNYVGAHNNLGLVFNDIGDLKKSIHCYERALELNPDDAWVQNNLGSVLRDLGQHDAAINCYKRALEIKPDLVAAYNNLLFCLNYHPDLSAETIFEYYQAYEQQFGLTYQAQILSFKQLKDPDKRLRIGYVSGDFKTHSMRHFLEPLLAYHNHQFFEITAYAELLKEDEFSQRFKGLVDHWVHTMGMTDEALAARIREDEIDILVDLAGHTAKNRLAVFARKPAPVSISMFGYGYTTGLTAIDYFLGDSQLIPEGSEHLFSEKPWRLQSPCFCYRPAEGMGEISSLPATSKGYISFGTLTRSVRINYRTIRVWAKILKKVTGSRLIINSISFCGSNAQQAMTERFEAEGIAADRLHIGYNSPPWDVLREMDIALDCFPHNSGTTLLESLYMGVPFVTLADRPSVGRIGASVLESVEHQQWIASNEEEYIEKAVNLASDLEQLAIIRSQLRMRMQALPVMDEAGFVSKLEAAYRKMWQQWCGQKMLSRSESSKPQQTLTQVEIDAVLALYNKGDINEALNSLNELTQKYPNEALLFNIIGGCYQGLGQLDAAINSYETALQIKPGYVEALNNIGCVFHGLGHYDAATKRFEQALDIKSDYEEAHFNFANMLRFIGQLDAATDHYEQAINIKPDYVDALRNLGSTYRDQGQHDAAIRCYKRALEIKPNYGKVYSNLLFCLNYHPDLSAETIFEYYQAYDQQFGLACRAQMLAFKRLKDPDKRLKIGYVSGDFKLHSMRHFLEPLLAYHNHQLFEITAYAELLEEDDFSQRFQGLVDHWVQTRGVSDEALAALIREDEIDILVDLAGHTANNRLAVFARKPAPVSISMFGYGYSTGLTAIDYFLGDDQLIPKGSEHLFSEKPWRLESPCYCYRPAEGMGEISPLPAISKGYITFATLTRSVRINHRTIRVWAKILKTVAGSRLIINSLSFRDQQARQVLIERFVAEGIKGGRLEIGYDSPPWELLRSTDITLDCFPHNSGTTLLESLYMGVPFVTLADRPSVGRIGASVLESVGYPQWIANNEEEYIEKTVNLAGNLEQLSIIRSQLRAEMEALPLMDEAGFVSKLETAYRQMWRQWCEQKAIRPLAEPLKPQQTLTQAEIDAVFALYNKGQIHEALNDLEILLNKFPNEALLYNIKGGCYQRLVQPDVAISCYKKALEIDPNYVNVHTNLANVFRDTGQHNAAINSYQQALKISPDFAGAHNNLGNALRIVGQVDEAIKCYRQALEINPDYFEAYNNLGNALWDIGKLDAAIHNYERALEINSDYVDAYNNLGNAYRDQGQFDEAVKCYEQALKINPQYAEAHYNLGNVSNALGQYDKAISCYQRGLEIKPDLAEARDNLLFCLNYQPDMSAEAIFEYYQDYDKQFGLPHRAQWLEFTRLKTADKRLKVGYVSGDFKTHSMRHFIAPLLANYDQQSFEITAYAELIKEDKFTRRFKSQVDHWVLTIGMTDEALADRIREDEIDILVDLAGHTVKNRLAVFARKPAPISVSMFGYGYTTGLTAIDYFLGDHQLIPEGSEHLFSEKPWRLQSPSFCYRPAEGMGEISALPAEKRGKVVFGTLSRSVRINHRTIRVWANILKRVVGSRLIINSSSFRDRHAQQAMAKKFMAEGIGSERLDIGYDSPPWNLLRGMDISLDCFPHNSGTTLLESLYMGVPFITLADRPSVGRIGATILESVGHQEWIASNEAEYIEKAVELAGDLGQLAIIRSQLRTQMEARHVMDETGFVRKLEAAYRQMWQQWCGQQTIQPSESQKNQESLAQNEVDAVLALYKQGNIDDALNVLDTLTQKHSNQALLYNIKGGCYQKLAQFDTAISCYETALEIKPDYVEALNNFGCVLQDLGQYDAAVKRYEKALQLCPGHAETHANLANVLRKLEQYAIAIKHYESALEINPYFAEAYNNLGNVFRILGEFDKAIKSYQQAVKVNPDYAEAQNNLGSMLFVLGQHSEANSCYERALAINPSYVGAYNNRGLAFNDEGKFKEAINCYERALEIKPGYAWARNNLGSVLRDLGQHDAAIDCYKRALESKPDLIEAYNNLLFCLNYHPDLSAETIFQSYQAYDQQFGLPYQVEFIAFSQLKDPDKRLKIGYVSGDFKIHSMRHFLEPLLAHHNHQLFEITAYAELLGEDDFSQRFQRLVDHWVHTMGMTDEALAARIREDEIDILIDLAGHTAKNRLAVFARKPAPISISMFGYGYTTGLTAIDYFLGDSQLTPEGCEHLFSEKPWKLESPCFCYRPAEGMGEVSPLPATSKGYISFGTLTRSVRINHRTIRVWANILKRVVGSRLIINSLSFRDSHAQQAMAERFKAEGITADRLNIGYNSPPWDVLREMDIALDCFPHNSGTTLLESLYMGVPFVTLADRPSVGRIGASVLESVGCQQWIARNEQEYIEKVVNLAGDLEQLAIIRSQLRMQMEAMPVMDEAGFVSKLEAAYRKMWLQWCEQKTLSSLELLPSQKILLQAEIDAVLALYNKGEINEVLNELEVLIKNFPNEALLYNLRGGCYQAFKQYDVAVTCYNKALEISPDYFEAYTNLGNVDLELGQHNAAIKHFKQALKINLDHAVTHNNLGSALRDIGQHDAAINSYKRALEITPDYVEAYNNLLFCLNYHPDLSAENIFESYQIYEEQFGLPYRAQHIEFSQLKIPDKRLKIGYVSGDFNIHSIRHFLEPLLAHHNHQLFEITAYAELLEEDGFSQRFQELVDHWVQTMGMTDEVLTARIRKDEIDILIDLAGHTAKNRLAVFARKPAPVSVSMFGYGYTTGLTAIDYFLGDNQLIPEGSEYLFSEKPWRLSSPCFSYRPAEGMGEPGPLPAQEKGWVTFGTLTRSVRINHRTIRVWANILKRVDGSRLVINSSSFRDSHSQQAMAERFRAEGIASERLEIGYDSPPWDLLREMDVGLDCFPHNSGTTLLESLYMGVPFITLADRPSVGRIGASILESVACPQWIAVNETEYIEKAVYLAADVDKLAIIRGQLRTQMEALPVMDEAGFVVKLETAYRQMWRQWCQQGGLEDPKLLESKMELAQGEIDRVLVLYNKGEINEALIALEALIKIHPNEAVLYNIKGGCYQRLKQFDMAVSWYKQACSIQPNYADAYNNLANTLMDAGRVDDAISYYQQALKINPNYAEAHNNLGNAFKKIGEFDAAINCYQKALNIRPDYLKVHHNLAQVLKGLGRLEAVIKCYEQLLKIKPDSVEVYNNLGNAHKSLGQLEDALKCYEQALKIKPDYIEVYNNTGATFYDLGQFDVAVMYYDYALQLNPDYVEAHNNRGNAYRTLGQFDMAIKCYERALEIKEDFFEAYSNLGNTLRDFCQYDAAINCYKRALEVKPDLVAVQNNLLFCLNYHPDLSAEAIFEHYQAYDRQFGLPYRAQWKDFTQLKDPGKRLKIGYVSGDFNVHSMRHFLEPVLAQHNHQYFEITAYAELIKDDGFTERFQGLVDHWVQTTGMTDEALAARIRKDEVDILVDLAGHTVKNRLAVFARKPAPVSISMFGYGYTTGLTAIDYFLGDEQLIPKGSEHLFSEKPWRLPSPGFSYRPAEGMGEPGPLPAKIKDWVTFGTLTRSVRINHRTIRVWADILKRVANSRLIINSSSFRDSHSQQAMAERFRAEGIASERLEIGYDSPPWELLREMDIGLDCFPHNSGTTLLESLYMGVPFITLADRPSVGRIGASILESVDCPQWIAMNEEQYIEKAVQLAADLDELAMIRSRLRTQMEALPVMDEVGFVVKLEAAYRQMWQQWCQQDRLEYPKVLESEVKLTQGKIDTILALYNKGQINEALTVLEVLTKTFPNEALLFNIKGGCYQRLSQHDMAIKCYEQALDIRPDYVKAHNNLGNALKQQGQLNAAIKCYEKALKIKPDYIEAYNNLGTCYDDLGYFETAIKNFEQALKIKPDFVEAHNNLGKVNKTLGCFYVAIKHYEQALKIKPDFVEVYNNLGNVYRELSQPDVAIRYYERALAIKWDCLEAYTNLGNTLRDLCQLDEAIKCYEKALEIKPGYAEAHANLLFCLNYHPDKSAEVIFEAYKDYDKKFAIPYRDQWAEFENSKSPDKRLKVAYVSGDYKVHSIRHFLEPILRQHNHHYFEITAYAELTKKDDYTMRYQGLVDHWVDTTGMSDEMLAVQIRTDGIDILVDLAGHTANNRLAVFARKPAPVSVSMFGYGYTTGLSAIDYFLGDWQLLPDGCDHLFSEKLWRLKTPGFCYRPAEGMGEVSSLPALTKGYITFGILSRAIRINYRTVRVWSKILKRVAGSRLIINNRFFDNQYSQQAMAECFVAEGIGIDRLEIGYDSPPWGVLRETDIGFDCFPHNSGTTLLENLYMGIPFVTLADRPSVGRIGASVLESVGHSEWIARNEEEYIEKVVNLASDFKQLAIIRSQLRTQMEALPLMDEIGFVKRLETAYRKMWQMWCK